MKTTLIAATVLLLAFPTFAQPTKESESKTIGGATLTIDYSSPKVNKRAGKIFTKDGLISGDSTYPVWRAGANTATKLTTSAAIEVGGVSLAPGAYSLYVDLSDPASWVLVINKATGQWGTKYDKSQDMGRAKMTMAKPAALVEALKYTVADKGGKKGALTLEWENVSATVPIVVK
jgi:hypothetical protein